jgi:metal-responsive CopG/Arc/MetJ family transcriptional regulator
MVSPSNRVESRRAAMARFSVSFSDEAYATLEEIARREGKTKVEVLRDALALEKWFQDTKRSGGRVLVERQNGTGSQLREVVAR